MHVDNYNETCAVCGKESEQKLVPAMFTTGSRFLDLRSSASRRLLGYEIQECPHCGYISCRISDETDIDCSLLETEEYKDGYGISFRSELAKKYYKAYVIAVCEDDTEKRFNNALRAAWASDDECDIENAVGFRKLALEEIDKLIEKSPLEKREEYLVQKADIMRRAGMFEALLNEYSDIEFRSERAEMYKNIIDFQKKAAKLCQSAGYTFNDVIKAQNLDEEKYYPMRPIREFIIDGDTFVRYNGSKQIVIIPDSIKHIAEKAFENCSVEYVILPPELKTIGENAFAGCEKLESIAIPDSTETIEKGAFAGCLKLERVYVSENTRIEDETFAQCYSLADEHGFVVVNNSLFEYCGMSRDVVIPNGVTRICSKAFCNSVTEKIVFAGTVTEIAANACRTGTLKKAYLTRNIKSIAPDAFCTDTGLTICAPRYCYAYKYGKANGFAVSTKRAESVSGELKIAEKTLDDKAAYEQKQRIIRYSIKPENLDYSHIRISTNAALPAAFDSSFYINGDFHDTYAEIVIYLLLALESGSGGVLLISAPTGCGKTHLLNMIKASIESVYPEKRVRMDNAENWLSEVRNAVESKDGSLDELLADEVLLIDDYHIPEETDTIGNKALDVFAHAITDRNKGFFVIASSDSAFNHMTEPYHERTITINLHPMDEVSRRAYAEEQSKKAGVDIAAEELDRIAFEAKDAYSVKRMITEYCKE